MWSKTKPCPYHARTQWVRGMQTHRTNWANYFNIMPFCNRNWVYTPNFGLKIRIFLRFAPPFVRPFKFAPPFSKVWVRDCKRKKSHVSLTVQVFSTVYSGATVGVWSVPTENCYCDPRAESKTIFVMIAWSWLRRHQLHIQHSAIAKKKKVSDYFTSLS